MHGVGISLSRRSIFTIAPGNSMVGLPLNTAVISFTFRVRSTINAEVMNTGISNGVIPVGRIIGANRMVRVLAAGRTKRNPDHS